jgi:hypothetical protein
MAKTKSDEVGNPTAVETLDASKDCDSTWVGSSKPQKLVLGHSEEPLPGPTRCDLG